MTLCRYLKIIENGTVWKLGYGFLFAFYSTIARAGLDVLWADNAYSFFFRVVSPPKANFPTKQTPETNNLC